jgi:hypothetical protein
VRVQRKRSSRRECALSRSSDRLLAVEGGPQNARFLDVPGYPTLAPNLRKDTRYYNFGVIALDGSIYQSTKTWPGCQVVTRRRAVN